MFRDPHSAAVPEQAKTRHLVLDLTIDMDARVLRGTATWDMHCEKDLWVPAGRNLQLSAELPGYQPLRTTFNVDPGNGTPSIVELLLQVAP